MKKLILTLFLVSGLWSSAQEFIPSNLLFLRVYDTEGKKMASGHVESVTNQKLVLRSEKKDSILNIPVSDLGRLRTKKTVGGYMLIGGLIGGSLGYGLLNIDGEGIVPNTNSLGDVLTSVTAGIIVGAAAGAGTSAFRKSKRYDINGDASKLEAFIKDLK